MSQDNVQPPVKKPASALPGEPTVQQATSGGAQAQFLKESAAGAWKALRVWAGAYSGCNRRLDSALNWARKALPTSLYERIADGCARSGHVAVLVAQVFAFLFGLTSAIKYSNWVHAVQGLGYAALLAILQYTAEKFLGAGRSLVETSQSRLGSKAFLDSFALLMEVSGVLAMIALSYAAQSADNWNLVWLGLGVWSLCGALGYIGIHPEMANVRIAPDVRAGEEAIGIMSFIVKALIRIVPVGFGVGAILGTLGLAAGTFSLMRNQNPESAYAALVLLIVSLALPFASYLLFAVYHLTVDVLAAILSIPERLEKLAKN